jgi:hypothetical protein
VSDLVRSTDRPSTGLPPRPHLTLAEGIIMGLSRCTPEEAFGQLRDVSRRHGIGVRVLASALVQAAMSGQAPRTAEEHERAELLALYWPLPLPTQGGKGRLPVQAGHAHDEHHEVVDLRGAK